MTVFGQVRVPFQERVASSNPSRKTFNVKGDFQLIGNTNLSLANYADDLMNDNLLLFEDVDSHANTINSSSAVLNFSKENGADITCTNVLFAGLYWSGRGPTDDVFYVNDVNGFPKKLDRQEITLFGPNDPVGRKFRAGDTDIRYTYGLDLENDLGLFVGFAEVTDFVKEHGEGEYTVADLGILEGTNYHYGGWSLVVVYENPVMENRSITVFDGYAFVRGSVLADFTIPISGFSAVDAGPVNMKLGIAAGEGDVAALGDYFEIERGVNTNDFVRLSHEGNTPDNFFNSSIVTGGNSRSPDLKNNTGMDISVFDIPNVGNSIISNGQTSTRFRYGTNGDAYVIYSIIMAVDANEPEIQGYHFVNSLNNQPFTEGESIIPGDELEIIVEVKNTGGVDLQDLKLEIYLPQGFEYVSSVGEYFFTNNSGNQPSILSNQIIWEIGETPSSSSPDEVVAKLTYTVRVTENCEVLIDTCSANFVVDGQINGNNGNSGKPIPTSPLLVGFSDDSQCINSPVFGPINFTAEFDDFLKNTCGYENGTSKITICVLNGHTEISTDVLTDYYPEGTRFYNEYPLTSTYIEYGNGRNFPIVPNLTYYAVLPSGGCVKEFGFKVSDVLVDVVIDDSSCESETPEREVSLNISNGFEPYLIYWDSEINASSDLRRKVLPGLHKIQVIDQNGCAANVDFMVEEKQLFTVELNKNTTQIDCPDEPNFSIELLISAESPDEYQVTIKGDLRSGEKFEMVAEDLLEGVYEYKDFLPGTYAVEILNSARCSQIHYFEVEEKDLEYLKANFDYTSQSLIDDGVLNFNFPILFEDLSEGVAIIEYSWDFGDGNVSGESDPIHQYTSPGKYIVSLKVSGLNGCIKENNKILVIKGVEYLRMPNAFSPNGDGQNDFYFPVFNQLQAIEFWVFNRWGEIVFYSNSLEDQGWDGSFKGKEAPSGTYVYKVDYRNETDSNDLKSQTGSFLLIK
ncbi:gliding motility-associated C-terminal domain-containing protein [Algoriphagus sp. C2-6-M1]|uniref:T9SS type B sorting domain-containing protein n=1 Tax=Algoriphagus persicinus TaxID=3108754 RepID=UPI002B36FD15|nr:gliding motility-associated C-terminal domain-containing protein [Algoriphagus sp. C2-6-M1]MEB2781823.1 gliding motility-associated C-terminal domain-containing protein [Algoriphagus sp. C2-6-M1]